MTKLRLKNFENVAEVSSHDYDDRLKALQFKLELIQSAYITQGLRGIVAVEGWDASGKGGLIKRLTAELDPRFTDVWSIGAPTKEELAHHFLWRFWSKLPAAREITVFDRTWYGRVLVERVDKLTPKKVWKGAYDVINAFEAEQAASGVRLCKIFMHITQPEQDKRLRERLETPWKRWKTGPEDYHNRSMRDEYTAAYEDMFDETSTDIAAWNVIAADDKKTARLAGMEAAVAALGEDLDLSYPPVDDVLRTTAEAALGVTLKL